MHAKRKNKPAPAIALVHLAQRGLTLRSRRGPTASPQARATGTVYIFCGPGLASFRWSRLNSNVRPQNHPLMLRTILTLLLFPVGAQAVERDLLNAVESVAGVYSSIYIHEFGHAVAYKAIGATDVTIDVPRKGSILSGQTSARFDLALTQDQKMIVSIAGFAAANLAGEVVL